MKILFLIIIVLFSALDCSALSLGSGVALETVAENESVIEGVINKKQKRKKKRFKNPPSQNNSDLYLLKIGLILTVGIGLAIGILLFQPIFIFGVAFFLGFLFVLANLCFTMGLILTLSRGTKNFREKNEEMAGYILLYMLSRIILLSIVFLLAPPVYGIILAVSFTPGFIVQMLIITFLLKTDNGRKERRNMFRPQSEPGIE